MYYYTWKPKAVEFEQDGKVEKIEPLFEGEIKIRAPKYTERVGYLKQAVLSTENNELNVTAMNADRIERMVEIAKRHIEEVNIVRIEDGYEFKSVDDLEYDTDGGNLLVQVASSVMEGVRLGKGLEKRSDAK